MSAVMRMFSVPLFTNSIWWVCAGRPAGPQRLQGVANRAKGRLCPRSVGSRGRNPRSPSAGASMSTDTAGDLRVVGEACFWAVFIAFHLAGAIHRLPADPQAGDDEVDLCRVRRASPG